MMATSEKPSMLGLFICVADSAWIAQDIFVCRISFGYHSFCGLQTIRLLRCGHGNFCIHKSTGVRQCALAFQKGMHFAREVEGSTHI
jgi:hypothetical protein